MTYRFSELCEKDVVNCNDGALLGSVSDIEISHDDCTATALFVECNKEFFRKHNDIRIPWDKIEKIGKDVIIINFCPPIQKEKHPDKQPKRHFFS